MAEVIFLNKEAEQSEADRASALAVLERVADGLRSGRLKGMMIVATLATDDPTREMDVEQSHVSAGTASSLTLLGLNKCFADYVSAYCVAEMRDDR